LAGAEEVTHRAVGTFWMIVDVCEQRADSFSEDRSTALGRRVVDLNGVVPYS